MPAKKPARKPDPFVEPPSLQEVLRVARRQALSQDATPEDFELMELVRDLLADK